MKVVCDIEANGLEPDTIWCISCTDTQTGRKYRFNTQRLIHKDFPIFASNVSCWVGHNFLGYDVPVMNRLINGIDIKTKDVIDTLILSKLFNPVRVGGHSLAAWGNRLGFPKVVHEDWSQYSEDMMHRCDSDVELNLRVYQQLMLEGKGFSNHCIRLEHNVTTILQRMKEHGFLLDRAKAEKLYMEIKTKVDNLEKSIMQAFPPELKVFREFYPRLVGAGAVIHGQDWTTITNARFSECFSTPDGIKYRLYHTVTFNPSSTTQTREKMDEAGWKPINFTTKGTPKVDDTNLATLPDTAPEQYKLIPAYRMATSRLKTVEQWLELADSNNRIHGQVSSITAITHRMGHSKPNMANIASVPYSKVTKEILYGFEGGWGYESRDVWTVPKGKVLLGCDASGIQLRMLAHFMNDPDYIDTVVNGDPHTKNMLAAGLATRDQAKTFIYAWLLGAGDAKIGQITDGTAKDGAIIKRRFLESLPSLARLKLKARQASKLGYLQLFDGRRVPIKSEHYALSAYLQGGEQAVMKKATELWWVEARRLGINCMPVAMVHDEWQTEVDEDRAEELGKIQVQAIRDAGIFYGLNCPMDGEFKIGRTWAETH